VLPHGEVDGIGLLRAAAREENDIFSHDRKSPSVAGRACPIRNHSW
jgi:hypothetical protein